MKSAHRSQLPPVRTATPMPATLESAPSQELQVLPRQATPDDLIFAAIANKVPIADLKELYALKREFEKDEARKAYVAAMAEFKRDPPEIFKRSQVSFQTAKGKTEYMHADLGEVCEQIVGALAMHGFSHAWNPTTNGKMIEVTCTLTHSLGHSESVTLSGASDDSGGKNAIQADASTRTYLQRYSLLAITGLATKDMDNDGRGADRPEYSDETLAKVSEFIASILEAIDETELRHVGRDIAGAGLPAEKQREVRDRYTARLVELRKAERARKEAEDAAIAPTITAAAKAGEA